MQIYRQSRSGSAQQLPQSPTISLPSEIAEAARRGICSASVSRYFSGTGRVPSAVLESAYAWRNTAGRSVVTVGSAASGDVVETVVTAEVSVVFGIVVCSFSAVVAAGKHVVSVTAVVTASCTAAGSCFPQPDNRSAPVSNIIKYRFISVSSLCSIMRRGKHRIADIIAQIERKCKTAQRQYTFCLQNHCIFHTICSRTVSGSFFPPILHSSHFFVHSPIALFVIICYNRNSAAQTDRARCDCVEKRWKYQ